MKKMILVLSAVLFGMAVQAEENPLVKGDAAAGKAKAATCAACHGADGNSSNPMWPKLAEQHALYLERQLKLFKQGLRPATTMAGMAAPLSEQDMADLAAYFESQKRKPGMADEALVELGRRVYHGGNLKTHVPACAACHGPVGEGNPLSKYPSLASQHATYVEERLKAFRAGETWGDADDVNGKIMADVAKNMTDEEIKAVSSYIQGLYPNE